MSKKEKKAKKREAELQGQQIELEAPELEAQPEAPKPRRTSSRGIRWGLSRLLSNLRFSLTLRIALHYSAQLFRTSFSVLLTVFLALSIALLPRAYQSMERLAENPPLEEDAHYSLEQRASESIHDAYLLQEPIPDTWEGFLEKGSLAFSRFQWGRQGRVLLYADSAQGPLVAEFEVGWLVYLYSILFWTLLCCDLYRMVYFLRNRNRLNRRVLQPISEMADAAAALSANNLSDRISIEGTKNELKDLALVINNMMDRIERSYNSQKQFVSDASHELRTPIAVIQGYASMLERWGKTDKAVLDEGIAAIAQETTAMKELVERLLFLARHDKKTLMLEIEVFDPTEVMSSVYRDAQLLSPSHRFELRLEASMHINGDKGMVKQLMRILVDNAIKYTPSGGEITLAMSRKGNECVLSVTDTGAGIPPQELSLIFDRFYRSDKARIAQSSGHGLGLSIARIIVVAHDGKLNVRSKEGVGTTFSVRFPVSEESRA